MKFITPTDFTAARAWDALPIAEIEGATVRLHWTDQPYVWHINDGAEAFVVLDGTVTMHYRRDGVVQQHRMKPGDINVSSSEGSSFLTLSSKRPCPTPASEVGVLTGARAKVCQAVCFIISPGSSW